MSDYEDGVQDNGLMIETRPSGLEKLWDYEPGGHHPIRLGDILHQRYKVIHKLGSGGYAVVWLCRDISAHQPRYLAVKVISAEGSTSQCPELRVNRLLERRLDKTLSSNYFCLPLDQFEIEGPNDKHYVFVYPVLGPRVSRMLNVLTSQDPGGPLRKICSQVTQAVSVLHSIGICHGDIRPANILARISGMEDLPEDVVVEALGKPQTTKVVTREGKDHDMPTAPQYLVYPVDWDKVALSKPGFIAEEACLIDFGEAYEMQKPTPDLGIPQVYCPPEYPVEGKVGVACDIWALDCTLFEIRTGRKLFDAFDDEPDEILYKMAMILGKFPEPWWSETWRARKEIFEDETDAGGRVVKVQQLLPSTVHGDSEYAASYTRSEPRSLQDAIMRGLFYEDEERPEGIVRGISREEADVFADLLAKLLAYSPKKRLSASKALEHDWFKFSSA